MFNGFDNSDDHAPAKEKPHLTIHDIAAQHSVAWTTVYKWITRGVLVAGMPVRLAGYKIGSRWRVRPEALEDFLRRCNPDTWRQIALEQDRERKQAEKDRKELRRKLEEMGTRPKPEEKYSRSYRERSKGAENSSPVPLIEGEPT